MSELHNPYPSPYGLRNHTPPDNDQDNLADPYYGISFGQSILRALHKTIDFKGYASRGEYWWFFLFTFLTSSVLSILATLFISSEIANRLSLVFFLMFVVPTLSLLWRRLHDAGFAGPWFFISLIPVLGGLAVLIMLMLPTRTDKRSASWDHPGQTTLTPHT
ncbi:MAG: DUF805 domain-containing protein [Corynebacterium sp.]|uniref:DUF805 domain-containing protein n=1 Tax=unclassified Corynebacterium TaxID=2624378 RepID=UPI00095B87A9|nr:DUF805 domain-containing protein [Corynebacterium sp. CNJ-954]OLT50249.1 hypothetical protein BJF89_09975 [Corynebacterium sp. CNJ-954]